MTSIIKRTVIMIISITMIFASFSVFICDEAFASSKLGQVKNLKVSSVTSSSCKLSWGKVSNAKGYKVYMKKDSGSYKLIKTTSSKTYKKTGLKSGTKYTFKVRAYKKSNGKTKYGKYSSAKSITTKLVYGKVTGNVTYWYNYKEYKPDVGAKVFLIGRNGRPFLYKGSFDNATAMAKYQIYRTTVDGMGNYVFDRIPTDTTYYICIISDYEVNWNYWDDEEYAHDCVVNEWKNVMGEENAGKLADVIHDYKYYAPDYFKVYKDSDTTISYVFK